jgi:hypothetical protein
MIWTYAILDRAAASVVSTSDTARRASTREETINIQQGVPDCNDPFDNRFGDLRPEDFFANKHNNEPWNGRDDEHAGDGGNADDEHDEYDGDGGNDDGYEEDIDYDYDQGHHYDGSYDDDYDNDQDDDDDDQGEQQEPEGESDDEQGEQNPQYTQEEEEVDSDHLDNSPYSECTFLGST